MLNNETGKINKPIRMDSNIFLGAGIRVGAIFLDQRLLLRKSRRHYISGRLQIVQNHPRSTRLINVEEME